MGEVPVDEEESAQETLQVEFAAVGLPLLLEEVLCLLCEYAADFELVEPVVQFFIFAHCMCRSICYLYLYTWLDITGQQLIILIILTISIQSIITSVLTSVGLKDDVLTLPYFAADGNKIDRVRLECDYWTNGNFKWHQMVGSFHSGSRISSSSAIFS